MLMGFSVLGWGQRRLVLLNISQKLHAYHHVDASKTILVIRRQLREARDRRTRTAVQGTFRVA